MQLQVFHVNVTDDECSVHTEKYSVVQYIKIYRVS